MNKKADGQNHPLFLFMPIIEHKKSIHTMCRCLYDYNNSYLTYFYIYRI
nr:MAG TPA: hypothetical protein [Caudoviricetes sp.]